MIITFCSVQHLISSLGRIHRKFHFVCRTIFLCIAPIQFHNLSNFFFLLFVCRCESAVDGISHLLMLLLYFVEAKHEPRGKVGLFVGWWRGGKNAKFMVRSSAEIFAKSGALRARDFPFLLNFFSIAIRTIFTFQVLPQIWVSYYFFRMEKASNLNFRYCGTRIRLSQWRKLSKAETESVGWRFAQF